MAVAIMDALLKRRARFDNGESERERVEHCKQFSELLALAADGNLSRLEGRFKGQVAQRDVVER